MGGLKGASDLFETWFPRYDLEITRSAPVSLLYDPKQEKLTLSLGLILNNKGTTSDAVERCYADLRSTTETSRSYRFSSLYIAFKDGTNQIPRNFTIQKETARSVSCELNAYMVDNLHELFQLHETHRELIITLLGHGQKSYLVKVALEFGAHLLDSPKNDPVTLTFLGSDEQ